MGGVGGGVQEDHVGPAVPHPVPSSQITPPAAGPERAGEGAGAVGGGAGGADVRARPGTNGMRWPRRDSLFLPQAARQRPAGRARRPAFPAALLAGEVAEQ